MNWIVSSTHCSVGVFVLSRGKSAKNIEKFQVHYLIYVFNFPFVTSVKQGNANFLSHNVKKC